MRSNQSGPHRRLGEVVRRHLNAPWHGPVHPASRQAYTRFASGPLAEFGLQVGGAGGAVGRSPGLPLILDSGCGTGASTARLAARFPEAIVVGIDRSEARLQRFRGPAPRNMHLVRARAEDFWRLLHADGIRPAGHFLFYPNPWPKAAHLKRRWHGHPVFPQLLALGGRLELRTNWPVYAEEFRRAAGICGIQAPPVVSFSVQSPLTPFERKYAESGHELYRLRLNLEESA